MSENNEQFKAFNVRLPKSLWAKFKKKTVDQDISMNSIIVRLINDYMKKSFKNDLTINDAKV